MTQAYDGFLQPSGLRTTQYSLLACLSHYGPLSITELAQRLGTDRTTLTRNLQPLVRERLVTIGRGGNGRTREVRITEAGGRAFTAAKPLWAEAQRHFLDRLTPEKWHELRTLLDRATGTPA